MTSYNDIIQSYCKALRANDYQAIISLFAKDAKVFSFFAGEKLAPEFFQNLFKTSQRAKVELKNLFVDVENKPIVAAYLYLEELKNEKEAGGKAYVDIFEFDSKNKITTLKIILENVSTAKAEPKG